MLVTPENKPASTPHNQAIDPWRIALAFDFGQRRIGIAIGEAITGSARPLCTLPTQRQKPDWDTIGQLITEWHPDRLVVGIPCHADGTANAITKKCLHFSRQLGERFHLSVDTIDERLSSWEAGQRRDNTQGGKNNTLLDADAAAIILESWINQPGILPRA
ncbi:MAG: Holliday junction resolvase RuvX [Candidatus Contendobacter odensis]|uniref:Putative pre-16S rRNA nuclease n=1 Tax=Candidatus Contendibacter odensensis TaxID=1400860 RepID=A0A2G6PFY5_9GAMM|nr:MAG: Holliday junction resolvase RuvX [Candidatus Contendobacter odensis]